MRGRNRNNNGGGGNNKGPNPLTRSYESNGPDVKVRGNAQTIAEKYMQLARDAMSSGDPVGAESYYQHAEHYVRIVLAAHEQLRLQYGENYRPQRPFGLQDQDDEDEEGDEPAEAVVQPARRGEGDQPDLGGDDDDALIADEMPARPMRDHSEPRQRFNDNRGEGREGRPQEGRRFDRDRQSNDRQNNDRQQQGDRQNGERRFDRGDRGFDRDRQDRDRQDRDRPDRDRPDRGPRENGRDHRMEGRNDDRGERRFERGRGDSRRDEPRRDDVRRDEIAASGAPSPEPAEDVSALPAFLTAPVRVPAAIEPVAVAVSDAVVAEAAPAPKRRGRPPRKKVEDAAESPGE
jgi:hypothetical protein